MRLNGKTITLTICLLITSLQAISQHSVARQWSEVMLEAIRDDYARPTVHARNLFHISMAMYDAWAVYDDQARACFLGNRIGDFYCPFDGVSAPVDIDAAREEAISYAAYRIMKHRFADSPGKDTSLVLMDSLMMHLGYDTAMTALDYQGGAPAALGNYIASQIIEMGFQDGSNEQNDYENIDYDPVNEPLAPEQAGNPHITNPNRWQPLTLEAYIDQSGNVIPGATPDFLSPEWGIVTPFALTLDDATSYYRGDQEYRVFHDPGQPPRIDITQGGGLSNEYKWNFAMVSVWGAHCDPADSVMIDISPASFGNNPIENYPTTIEGLRDFYNFFEGGDYGTGRDMNPVTGMPYPPQMVPRGDYARVLAEFWADGPDSETPPGHWYTILNYVTDHPMLEKKYKGEGAELDDLEWDVKAYFILGGAVHDAAVAAWGIKGWYDYLRPISAIRFMADRGQSTDTLADNFHVAGIPLIPGYIETVEEGDPLAEGEGKNVGKIKLYTWRGPDFIEDPDTSVAGVGWILAENWWPYQRPTFVTPPFAGYISGHSTFSRAAAEVMTLFTGDEYFPGGVGEFHAPKNEFLVFEDGPSQDLTLQWATYRDASDQTSLSRIWGGIHPPVDDVPGRLIGAVIGVEAFDYADCFFRAPSYVLDTVRLECAESTFEWPLDFENVNSWAWEVSDNPAIEGAEDGTTDTLTMLTADLVNKSSTDQFITYTIHGWFNNCEATTQEVVISFGSEQEPIADFIPNVTDTAVHFANISEYGAEYQWEFGDGSTSIDSDPSHVYDEDGMYEVTLIVSNVCGADTITQEIFVMTTSTREVLAENTMSLSPNPTNGVFTIDPGEFAGECTLRVFNLNGQLAESRDLNFACPEQLDLSLASGMYYVVVDKGGALEVLKLVVTQ